MEGKSDENVDDECCSYRTYQLSVVVNHNFRVIIDDKVIKYHQIFDMKMEQGFLRNTVQNGFGATEDR